MTAAHDPGLQPERTELSWRRTLLTLAVGSLVSVRVLPGVLGAWTIAAGLGGFVVVAVFGLLARRRHARVTAVFRGELPRIEMPGGALLAALALFAAVGAALGLVAALAVAR